MIKKIFLSAAILFLFSQNVSAQHNWVWTGDGIEVYIEDTTIDFSDNGKEFSVTVIDKVIGQKKSHLSRFNFYQQGENWFYNITGKGNIIPVSKTNASGYILEFVEKLMPAETDSESEEYDEE